MRKISLNIWVPSSTPCRLARGHPSSSCPAFWLTQRQEYLSTKSDVQKEEEVQGEIITGTVRPLAPVSRPDWDPDSGGHNSREP